MQNFPILKKGQVALMRADTLKGYVLDELFTVATTDEQKVFTVISNIEEANNLANQIIKDHDDVECVIYDFNKKVVSFLRPVKYKR